MRDEGWISGGIGIFLTGLVLLPIIVIGLEHVRVIGIVVFSLIFVWASASLVSDVIHYKKDRE